MRGIDYITNRLKKLGRPLSIEDNVHIGNYANCILHIELHKYVVVKMSKMYYGEFFLVQSTYP